MEITHIDLTEIAKPHCPVTGVFLKQLTSSAEIAKFRLNDSSRWDMEVYEANDRSLSKLLFLWDNFVLDTRIAHINSMIDVFASAPEVSVLLELHADSDNLLLVEYVDDEGKSILYLADPKFNPYCENPEEEE